MKGPSRAQAFRVGAVNYKPSKPKPLPKTNTICPVCNGPALMLPNGKIRQHSIGGGNRTRNSVPCYPIATKVKEIVK